MLAVGKKAPMISIVGPEGKSVSLKDLKGSYVVLYFYPKDDTPGCTVEACAFRDDFAKIKKLGAQVIGVSGDSVASHEKFSKKFKLNFTLWSDPTHEFMASFGVWGEKKFMGRTYQGILRTTFLIDPHGVVRHVWEKVKPEGHAEEVYTVLHDLILKK